MSLKISLVTKVYKDRRLQHPKIGIVIATKKI